MILVRRAGGLVAAAAFSVVGAGGRGAGPVMAVHQTIIVEFGGWGGVCHGGQFLRFRVDPIYAAHGRRFTACLRLAVECCKAVYRPACEGAKPVNLPGIRTRHPNARPQTGDTRPETAKLTLAFAWPVSTTLLSVTPKTRAKARGNGFWSSIR